MKVTSNLSPYLVKRFKILELSSNEDSCNLVYVNTIENDDLIRLQDFIGKTLVFSKQMVESQFWKLVKETYPDVSFPNIENDDNPEDPISEPEEIVVNTSKTPPLNVGKMDLSLIPLNELLMEVRKRQIATQAESIIHITPDNKAGFEFTKLSWPAGKFRVAMTIIEEIHDQKETDQ